MEVAALKELTVAVMQTPDDVYLLDRREGTVMFRLSDVVRIKVVHELYDEDHYVLLRNGADMALRFNDDPFEMCGSYVMRDERPLPRWRAWLGLGPKGGR